MFTGCFKSPLQLKIFAAVIVVVVALRRLRFRHLSEEKVRFLYLLIFVPFSLLIFFFITADWLNFTFFTGLQLSRSIVLWKIIMPIIVLFYFYDLAKSSLLKRDIVFKPKSVHISGAIIVIFVIILGVLVDKSPTIFIRPVASSNPSFVEMCSYMKNSTARHALVISEPFSDIAPELRLLCDKDVYFARVDASQILFDRKSAFEWERRKIIIDSLKDDGNLEQILKSQGVNYLISATEIHSLGKRVLFENNEYRVYEL